MRSLSKEKLFIFLFQFFFITLLASIVFSWRAVSSASLGFILLTGILSRNVFKRGILKHFPFSLVLASCLLLFALTCIALLYTDNNKEGLSQLAKKSGILIIPVALYASGGFLNRETYQRLLNYFTFFLFLASIICLSIATFNYFKSGNTASFFYFNLVSPFGQHAIQFSILVFFDLLFLFNCLKGNWVMSKPWLISLIIFNSLLLVLLSSKLIFLIYLVWLAYYVFWRLKISFRKSIPFLLPLLTFGIILCVTSNPFSQRFRLLVSGNKELFLRDRFDPGTYFNGIQFRLLEWRITREVLSENNAWILGVGPGDAQDLLNKKYEEKNMYLGKDGQQKGGYWNYHTHNQFLQTTLQNGLAGLITFFLFWLALILCAIKIRDLTLKVFVLMLFLYCFSDAPLETQYGMVVLIFLPLFYYLSHRFNGEIQPPDKVLATK